MKFRFRLSILALSATTAYLSADQDPPGWVEHARTAAQQLQTSLGMELSSALTEGGPTQAIEVCHSRAPKIAKTVSTDRIEIGRTALRARNPENQPDDWERRWLEEFDARIKSGASPEPLESWSTEMHDGRMMGRWIKPITTGQACTICHGTAVDPSLMTEIRTLYPEDQATGFELGQMRGAFTAWIELETTPQSD